MSGNGPRCANHQVFARRVLSTRRRLFIKEGHKPSSIFALSVSGIALSRSGIAPHGFGIVLSGSGLNVNNATSTCDKRALEHNGERTPTGQSGRHKRKGLGINRPA
jgi:hypothetical protein